MKRVGHEIIQGILQLHQGHDVTLLLRTMGLGLSMKLKIREAIDEGNTPKISRKRLSRPP
jgi:trehalose utilization protein